MRMRLLVLAILVGSAGPALAQSGSTPAGVPADTTSIFDRTYTERSLGLTQMLPSMRLKALMA